MSDDRLDDALRSLPRVKARKGFTDEVLARLDETAGRRRPEPATWAAVVLAAAGAALLAIWLWPAAESGSHLARELQELRAEHESLSRLIDTLGEDEAGDLPLLFLALGEEEAVVLDLEALLEATESGRSSQAVWQVQTASLRY